MVLLEFKHRRAVWGVCTLGIHTVYCSLAREHRRLLLINEQAADFITPADPVIHHDHRLRYLVDHLINYARLEFPLIVCKASRGTNKDAQHSHVANRLYNYVKSQKLIQRKINDNLDLTQYYYNDGFEANRKRIHKLNEDLRDLNNQSEIEGNIADIRYNQIDLVVSQATHLAFIPSSPDISLKLITSSVVSNNNIVKYDDYMSSTWAARMLRKIPFYGRSFGFTNRLDKINQ